jgi:hypothetical protein
MGEIQAATYPWWHTWLAVIGLVVWFWGLSRVMRKVRTRQTQRQENRRQQALEVIRNRTPEEVLARTRQDRKWKERQKREDEFERKHPLLWMISGFWLWILGAVLFLLYAFFIYTPDEDHGPCGKRPSDPQAADFWADNCNRIMEQRQNDEKMWPF